MAQNPKNNFLITKVYILQLEEFSFTILLFFNVFLL